MGLVLLCTLRINLIPIRTKNAYNHHEDLRPSPRVMLGKIVCMHYIRFALQIWRLFQSRMEPDWYQTKNASQTLATNTIVEFIHLIHYVNIRWIWHNIDAIYILSAGNSNAMSNNLFGRGMRNLTSQFQLSVPSITAICRTCVTRYDSCPHHLFDGIAGGANIEM